MGWESLALSAGRTGAGFIPNPGARLGVQSGISGLRGAMAGIEAAGAGGLGASGAGLAGGAATAAAPSAAAFSAAMAPIAIYMAVAMAVGAQKKKRIEGNYRDEATAQLQGWREKVLPQYKAVLERYLSGDRSPETMGQLSHIMGSSMITLDKLRQPQGAERGATQFRNAAMSPLYSELAKEPESLEAVQRGAANEFAQSEMGMSADEWQKKLDPSGYWAKNFSYTDKPWWAPSAYTDQEWSSMTGQEIDPAKAAAAAAPKQVGPGQWETPAPTMRRSGLGGVF